ncbi:hypothetical protein E2493_16670 [Sphingomonas parva]|uniref:Uncharacterized protein n=1 Tax=Sphingomonas parva TaxID=2555898 RepID=A0A4Y8ZPH2_9SPHN|nr:hypothetical protein [Sphingomonas parva]TFI57142.1 hypothetical protein E2493_16670 [Sphingomonas parva]
MSTAAEDPVKLRLRARKTNDQGESVASFVARYLDEIQAARHEGKSWDAIGRDLRPDNPIKGDTVRKSVERAEKAAASKAKPKRLRISRASKARFPNAEPQPVPAQLELGMPAETAKSSGLFSRRVDPLSEEE